jgi:hypothetical protein
MLFVFSVSEDTHVFLGAQMNNLMFIEIENIFKWVNTAVATLICHYAKYYLNLIQRSESI